MTAKFIENYMQREIKVKSDGGRFIGCRLRDNNGYSEIRVLDSGGKELLKFSTTVYSSNYEAVANDLAEILKAVARMPCGLPATPNKDQ